MLQGFGAALLLVAREQRVYLAWATSFLYGHGLELVSELLQDAAILPTCAGSQSRVGFERRERDWLNVVCCPVARFPAVAFTACLGRVENGRRRLMRLPASCR